MTTKITRDVLESHLQCRYKGYLKLLGQRGSKSDYETMLRQLKEQVKLNAVEKLLALSEHGETIKDVSLTVSTLSQKAELILDSTFEDERLFLRFDGLKKEVGSSALGEFYYVPLLFNGGEQVDRNQKLMLEMYAVVLSQLQGRVPSVGIVWHGKQKKSITVRLSQNLRAAERFLDDVKQMQGTASDPKLLLNNHCQICEFRQRCRTQAVEEDSLSLLQGMSAQEIARQKLKGIFTVNQLSYTFRTRRNVKRVKKVSTPHHFALQALAIRENKVFVHGKPILACKDTRIYFDIEGTPDTHSYYLIGLITVDKGIETRQSYWADDEDQQLQIFSKLLEHLNQYPEYSLLHFGSYDVNALRHMKKQMPQTYQIQMDQAIERSVNLLSIISPHIYFPTYSNGLKDIGSYLGCTWADPFATGVQSRVLRERWIADRDDSWKNKLIQYNLDDCVALKRATEYVEQVIIGGECTRSSMENAIPFVFTDTLPKCESYKHTFGNNEFVLEDLASINKCAYFDYQRDRVFARSSDGVRKARRSKEIRRYVLPKENRVVEIQLARCPICRSRKIEGGRQLTRNVIDLKISPSGVKRWIVRYVSRRYRCAKCGYNSIPQDFPTETKYGRSLVCWCIYHLIACGQNMGRIEASLEDVFGLPLPRPSLHRFKVAVAQYYEPYYEQLFQEILKGHILHIDETEVDLRDKKGYVWVIASLNSAYYFYRASREGSFLEDMLKGFPGVLISDFYTAYDSLKILQQRCLIHLIRDLNDDLLKNPFNEEYKDFAQRFSTLLKTIVDTIDRFGLKKRHLHKHKAAVEQFCRWALKKDFTSEVARKYQKKFQKYETMLFTFLDHDAVPWNNNNAEHAMKSFARYRRFADGRFTENSIQDYLVLLSLYQTCRYRGINFLKFLIGEKFDPSFGPGVRKLPLSSRGTSE